jgi:hypothetical protein
MHVVLTSQKSQSGSVKIWDRHVDIGQESIKFRNSRFFGFGDNNPIFWIFINIFISYRVTLVFFTELSAALWRLCIGLFPRHHLPSVCTLYASKVFHQINCCFVWYKLGTISKPFLFIGYLICGSILIVRNKVTLVFFTGHLHASCHPFFVVYIELHHHLCLKTPSDHFRHSVFFRCRQQLIRRFNLITLLIDWRWN